MKKNRIIACSVILVVVAIAAGYGMFYSGNGRRISGQSDYPELPEPALVSEVPTSLSDQVQDASLIVDATVLRAGPR